MDYSVSSSQYLALVAVTAIVSFSTVRFGGWDLSDPNVTIVMVALAVVIVSLLVFGLQYARARYGPGTETG